MGNKEGEKGDGKRNERSEIADLRSGIWKLSALVGGVERANCPLCRGRSCRSSSIKLLGDAEMQKAFL